MSGGIILAIMAIIGVVAWCLYRITRMESRCPKCGADQSRHPHKPRCNYWRDQ